MAKKRIYSRKRNSKRGQSKRRQQKGGSELEKLKIRLKGIEENTKKVIRKKEVFNNLVKAMVSKLKTTLASLQSTRPDFDFKDLDEKIEQLMG